MKFSCEKALLQKAVNVASRAVAQKSSIPELEGLMVEAGEGLTISGYNLQIGIRAKTTAEVMEPGKLVLDTKLFGSIISKMPDDMVTLSALEGEPVHLTCGDACFEIMSFPADNYPEMPKVDGDGYVSIQQGMLRGMIDQTSFAISTNESRPIHTGALFEVADGKLTVVAVDGFRMAIRTEQVERAENIKRSFVVPGSALSEVQKICKETENQAEIMTGKHHILFKIGDVHLISRRLEGEFLDYKSALPRQNRIAVTAKTKSLIESIDRVSVVISEKLKSPVRCLFDEDRVMLSAKTGSGEAKDVCGVSGNGRGLEIGFNNRYLLDALRYAPADTVRIELNTAVSPAIIAPVDSEENFLYMVLPVRLKAQA